MHKRITFKNMEKSEVMETYALEHLEKIVEFLSNEPTPVYIDLILQPSKTREHHRIELLVKSPHYDLISSYEHQGTEFYDALNRVIDTMYRELHEHKRRLIDERKREARADEFKNKR